MSTRRPKKQNPDLDSRDLSQRRITRAFATEILESERDTLQPITAPVIDNQRPGPSSEIRDFELPPEWTSQRSNQVPQPSQPGPSNPNQGNRKKQVKNNKISHPPVIPEQTTEEDTSSDQTSEIETETDPESVHTILGASHISQNNINPNQFTHNSSNLSQPATPNPNKGSLFSRIINRVRRVTSKSPPEAHEVTQEVIPQSPAIRRTHDTSTLAETNTSVRDNQIVSCCNTLQEEINNRRATVSIADFAQTPAEINASTIATPVNQSGIVFQTPLQNRRYPNRTPLSATAQSLLNKLNEEIARRRFPQAPDDTFSLTSEEDFGIPPTLTPQIRGNISVPGITPLNTSTPDRQNRRPFNPPRLNFSEEEEEAQDQNENQQQEINNPNPVQPLGFLANLDFGNYFEERERERRELIALNNQVLEGQQIVNNLNDTFEINPENQEEQLVNFDQNRYNERAELENHQNENNERAERDIDDFIGRTPSPPLIRRQIRRAQRWEPRSPVRRQSPIGFWELNDFNLNEVRFLRDRRPRQILFWENEDFNLGIALDIFERDPMEALAPAFNMNTSSDCMPKYEQKLTTNQVRLFLRNFRLWTNVKRLNDASMKFMLPLAFKNPEATQWFQLNHAVIEDPLTDFDALCEFFLRDAPMHNEGQLKMHDILSETPKDGESASAYLFRLRFKAGDAWETMTEETIVDILVDNLPEKLATFIDARGRPATFDGLKQAVKLYEQKNDSRTGVPTRRPKQEANIRVSGHVAETETNNGTAEFLKIVCQELAAVNAFMSEMKEKANTSEQAQVKDAMVRVLDQNQNGDQRQQPQDNRRQNRDDQQQPRQEASRPRQNHNQYDNRGPPQGQRRYANLDCRYCGKRGHIERECYSRKRDLGEYARQGPRTWMNRNYNQAGQQNDQRRSYNDNRREWVPPQRGPAVQYNNGYRQGN
ncbi:unnamed protein product [Orchesella dallaii]|uniref:CCHC-type domain-containing protein n=1 Tax=Orchesella dallaii TaxID=48710 RepID=A0ABP1PT31_9HEXA